MAPQAQSHLAPSELLNPRCPDTDSTKRARMMNGPRVQPAQWSRDALMLFLYCLPASLILWLVNTLRVNTLGGEVVEPMRWLGATCVPILVAWWGLKKRSLSLSGAFSGLFVGFILTVSSYVFMANLLVFFVTSSRATKYKAAQKKKLEMEFKEGGQRNWVQIICNGGVASFLAWLYIVDCGCGEHPIDLVYNYRCSWLAVAVLGALACCNGDTWASELGTILSSGDPVLITSLQPVPKGTNGGVSFPGLVVSTMGGLVVGLGHYIALLLCTSPSVMLAAPPQWPVIFVGAMGGLLGSLIDSVLGATFQFSGVDDKGFIVEKPGAGIIPISGSYVLDNHAVNLLSSFFTAMLLPRLALMIM